MNMHMYIHKHICIYIYMTNTVVCYNAAAIFWNRPPPPPPKPLSKFRSRSAELFTKATEPSTFRQRQLCHG